LTPVLRCCIVISRCALWVDYEKGSRSPAAVPYAALRDETRPTILFVRKLKKMTRPVFLKNADILATLREVNAGTTKPLWLFGGVAVDFLAGQWTRPHGDIDLNTFEDYHAAITQELHKIGYRTSDSGWLTNWYQDNSGRRLEIVFLERKADGTAAFHIHEGDAIGTPGLYPTLPDYLDPNRFAILEGVKFRVCSPAGEWLARANGLDVVGKRDQEPKLAHDQQILETLLSQKELIYLRSILANRATD